MDDGENHTRAPALLEMCRVSQNCCKTSVFQKCRSQQRILPTTGLISTRPSQLNWKRPHTENYVNWKPFGNSSALFGDFSDKLHVFFFSALIVQEGVRSVCV